MSDLSDVPREELETAVVSCLKEIEATGQAEGMWYAGVENARTIMKIAHKIGFKLD